MDMDIEWYVSYYRNLYNVGWSLDYSYKNDGLYNRHMYYCDILKLFFNIGIIR